MQAERFVFVKCQFSRGGFPSELVFTVQAPGGGVYIGIAPVEYCYTDDGRPLTVNITRGEKLPGYIAGVLIGKGETKGLVRVQLPDGDVYEIGDQLVKMREDIARVPLQS